MTKKAEVKEIEIFVDQSSLPVGIDQIEKNRELVYATNGGLDAYLEHIKDAVSGVVIDYETEEGRKFAGQLIKKVGSSKTLVEKPGRAYLKDVKASVKPIEANLKAFVDGADAVRDTLKAPLDKWKAKEAEKQAAKQAIVDWFPAKLEIIDDQMRIDIKPKARLDYLNDAIAEVNAFDIAGADELKGDAATGKLELIEKLNSYVAMAEKLVAEEVEAAANAEKLRLEEQQRLIDQAAEKAADDARRDAARIANEAELERQRSEAQRAEDLRIEKEAADAAELARLASEEHKAHKIGVLRGVLSSLQELGLTEEQGRAVIEMARKNKDVGLTITYEV